MSCVLLTARALNPGGLSDMEREKCPRQWVPQLAVSGKILPTVFFDKVTKIQNSALMLE